MTDFTKIERQIDDMRPYAAFSELPASALNQWANTMQALLDVARAADGLRKLEGFSGRRDLHDALTKLRELNDD